MVYSAMCKCIRKGANSVFFIHTFAKRSNGVFRAKWALNSVDTSLQLSPPLPYCLCWTLPPQHHRTLPQHHSAPQHHRTPIACAELSYHSTVAVPQSHSALQHHRTPIAWSVSQWPLPPNNELALHGIAWYSMLLYSIAFSVSHWWPVPTSGKPS